MAYFRYRIITKEGRINDGILELPFENPLSAIAYLERQGDTVVFADPMNIIIGGTLSGLQHLSEKKITLDDVSELLQSLSVMLKAGVPLMTAVDDVMVQSEHPSMVRMGNDLMYRIQAGTNFSEAASNWKNIFPNTALLLIRIGEETGKLDKTMLDASNYVAKIARIRKDFKSALSYPIIMLIAILLAATFWLIFVVPMMLDLLSSMHQELPPLTKAVIALSEFLQAYISYVAIGLVLLVLAFHRAMQHHPFRRTVHMLLLNTPVINTVISGFNLALLTENLSLLLNAGLDIVKSLDVLGQAISNEIYKEKLVVIRSDLLRGVSIHAAFQNSKVFPSFVVRMIGVGELSGSLPEQLISIAREYESRFDDVVKGIGGSIQPIALIIGGGIFVTMLIAMFMPLYSMS